MKTLKEVDNYINELENEISIQERYLYSNDILIGSLYEPNFLEKLENELKYYTRISNKLFDKFLKS